MFGYISNFEGDIFDRLDRMHREMDRLFSGRRGTADIRSIGSGSYPQVNVGVQPNQVDVYVFAAGLDPNAIDITLHENLLTISGERKSDAPADAKAYRRERFNGGFRRIVSLPEGVDPDKVSAAYRNGVLHITVQRHEAARPRKISVN